jgi:MtN3 and saliva related transmembrane protein
MRKAWPRGSTKDLSLGMLMALTLGLELWIVYGVLRGNWAIISANLTGAATFASKWDSVDHAER